MRATSLCAGTSLRWALFGRLQPVLPTGCCPYATKLGFPLGGAHNAAGGAPSMHFFRARLNPLWLEVVEFWRGSSFHWHPNQGEMFILLDYCGPLRQVLFYEGKRTS